MKKSLFSFGSAVLFAAVLTLSGCSWELPQTVGVKTNASYEFGFGEVKQDFGEKVSISEMFKDTNSSAGTKVYDYNPGSNTEGIQEFVIGVSIKEMSLDDLGLTSSVLSLLSVGDSVAAKAAGFTLPNQTGSQDVPFSFKDIFAALENVASGFSSDVNLCELPVYLYFKLPNGLGADFTCNFKFRYEDSTGDVSTAAGKNVALSIDQTKLATPPAFPAVGETVTLDIPTLSYSATTDLADFANFAKPYDNGKTVVDYTLTFTDLKKTADPIEGKLEIYAVMVLPVKFLTTSPISINMLEKAGKGDEDFFGRSEAGTPDNMKKIMDVADEISINYTIKELPMIANMNFDVDFDADGKKDSSGDSKSGKASINRYTLSNMLNTYPCKPSICLTVPSGEIIKMKRTMSMNLSITMGLKTNGTINVYEKGGK